MATQAPAGADKKKEVKKGDIPGMMDFPIYSMEVVDNRYIYFGGGGGYEIPNEVLGYELKDVEKPTRKKVANLVTDPHICSYMHSARDGKNIMAGCVGPDLVILSIDYKTGRLSENVREQADFSSEDPAITKCCLSFDNKLVATGGDDCKARLFQLSDDCKQLRLMETFACAEMAIQCVDLTRRNSLMLAGSKDGNCYVIDLKTKQTIKKFSFKCAPNQKNLMVRGCQFLLDSSILTLHMFPQKPSYLIRWRIDIQDGGKRVTWHQDQTKEVHQKPSSTLRAFQDKVAVGTSDGFVAIYDSQTLAQYGSLKKLHKMPVTSLAFNSEDNRLITGSVDYRYLLTPLNQFSAMRFFLNLLTYCGILLILLLYYADYLV